MKNLADYLKMMEFNVRVRAWQDLKLKIPAEIYKSYGEKLGGTNTGDPSCTFNGYTWARNVKVVRVFRFSDRHLPENGAELY